MSPDRTRCFNFHVCQCCRVPWTLMRIFPQAISKTASCVTSGTLHFFSYTLNPFSHHIVFPGHFRTYPRRVCSLNEPTNKSKAWITVLRNLRQVEEQRRCKLLLQISTLPFSSCSRNTELVKVPAARVWASLHWHYFKRALPVLKKTEGTSLSGEC